MADLTLLDGVAWQGRAVPAGRGQDLLAALVSAFPRSATAADLVGRVWAEDEPAHPDKALQVLVSRVRTQTAAETIVRVGAGYRLALRDDQVDLLLLRRLVDDAVAARAAGDLDVARLQAREALGLPLTTNADHGPLAEVMATAADLRSRAARLLGQVLLTRGDAGEALPLLLDALVQSPDDEERLAEVLRAEAQARGVPAALARYAAYAERVLDTVGAAPGEDLQRLHAELLARDAPVRQGLKYDASPLLGRDDDVVRIRGSLGTARVVSIVGAGGLGKTRMAHLVGRLAQQPVVYVVELAGVTAPEGVLPEVGGVLGVRESVTERRTASLRADLRSRVAERLGGAPTLLVLDNCEHLVDAVADLVAFLVASVDTVSVLTTSRAPLGIAAEQVYLLPELDHDSSLALFAERARSARPGVRLDPAEVGALVDRLDGLPLAIELAAAKVRAMSVAEITRRLADRFALLSGHDRSAPDRHRTLEAVIAWSWNLLGEREQRALRMLAVFPDGFSLEGASALLGHDALPELAELADQSLLVVREDAPPTTGTVTGLRYRFLETVREYGLKQLEAAAETAEVRGRLRDWAVGTGRTLSHRTFGPDQVAAIEEARTETGNLAGVLRQALEDGDAATVVPLAGALMACWTIEGDHLATLELSREVLDLVVDAPDPEPGRMPEYRLVLVGLIVVTTFFARIPAGAGLRRLRQVGVAGDGSHADAAVRLLLEAWVEDGVSEALDRLVEDPDHWVALHALQWATQVRENAGDVAGATEAGRRGLALCDDSDGPWTRALFGAQLAGLCAQVGNWEDAVAHARSAIPVMVALGAAEDALELRGVLAYAAIADHRLDEAERLVEEMRREDGGASQLVWGATVTTAEAELALARGDVETGLRLLLDALSTLQERRMTSIEMPVEQTPWVLYSQATVLVAHVVHGRRQDAEWVARLLHRRVPDLLRVLPENPMTLDVPVLGAVLVALGIWAGTGDTSPEADDTAAGLIALGEHFGYPRRLPVMDVASVRRPLSPQVVQQVDRRRASYAGVRAADLLDEVRDLVGHIALR